jgi:peptidyl-prolyl cis-trans isomerase SurA
MPLCEAFADAELLDRIAAVIDDQVILTSEVDEEVYFASLRGQLDRNDPAALRQARAQVLEGMIEGKILLGKARAEGIRVGREEIDADVDRMLGELRERFASEEEFEREIAREGTTLDELRVEYRERVEEQIMVRRLVDRSIRSQVEVDDREVRDYWNAHQAELPKIPAQLSLRRILVKLDAKASVDSASVRRANLVLGRLEQGEDFAALATVFSEGPTASRGGDLGWFRLEDLEPQLAAAVASLSPGSATPVVLTSRGAQILKVEERKEDQLHLRQIVFLRDEKTVRAAARARIEGLRARVRSGESFADLARQESDDEATRDSGGSLGAVSLESMRPEYRKALEGLEPGQTSEILEDEEGLSIFHVDGREGEREPTFEDVADRIRYGIEQEKAQKLYTEYLARAREETHVENRLAAAD